ncbi:MAG: hypothetical protein IPN76_30690 [Saprospiraceae bacterium]|nr:hypothetical protein [Saprospiraceae bacterium]
MTFYPTSTCAPTTTTCQATFTVAAAPTVVLTCPTNANEPAGFPQDTITNRFNRWLATASASGGCNGVLTNNNTGAPPATGGFTTVTLPIPSTCAPLTTTCQATFLGRVRSPPMVPARPTQHHGSGPTQAAATPHSPLGWQRPVPAARQRCSDEQQYGRTCLREGSTTSPLPIPVTCATARPSSGTFTVAAPPNVTITARHRPRCLPNAGRHQRPVCSLAGHVQWPGGCGGVLANNNAGDTAITLGVPRP